MRFFLVVVILGFGFHLSAQQECKTNLFLDATLDTIAIKRDAVKMVQKDTARKQTRQSGFVDYSVARISYYILKPSAPSYEIVSFTVLTEEGEYINEVPCQGPIVSQMAERTIWQRKKGTPVYFTCIRVKHPNGKIYILKDLTVNLH